MENKKTIEKIIEYIEDNLDNQLNLDDIAKEAAYSKFHPVSYTHLTLPTICSV